MSRHQLVAGLAAAFIGMGATLAVVSVTTGALLGLLPAVLFGLVAYFMWYHASGRLAARVYAGVEAQATRTNDTRSRSSGFGADPRQRWKPSNGSGRRQAPPGEGASTRRGYGPEVGSPSVAQAAAVLGIEPDADERTVRAAYREQVKEVHPDTDGGDEEQFKRVTAAYDVLAE